VLVVERNNYYSGYRPTRPKRLGKIRLDIIRSKDLWRIEELLASILLHTV